MGHGPLIERFYANTKDSADGCLIWQGHPNVDGYGTIMHRGRHLLAHRVAWEIVSGAKPAGLVCHSCDNPICVRFEHLFLGTNADNIKDRDAKGRQARGQRAGLAKLNDTDIPEIRKRLSQGEAQWRIAKDFGVSQAAIAAIKLGNTWTHIP